MYRSFFPPRRLSHQGNLRGNHGMQQRTSELSNTIRYLYLPTSTMAKERLSATDCGLETIVNSIKRTTYQDLLRSLWINEKPAYEENDMKWTASVFIQLNFDLMLSDKLSLTDAVRPCTAISYDALHCAYPIRHQFLSRIAIGWLQCPSNCNTEVTVMFQGIITADTVVVPTQKDFARSVLPWVKVCK